MTAQGLLPPFLQEGSDFEKEHFPHLHKSFNETLCKSPCSPEIKAVGDCVCHHIYSMKVHDGVNGTIDHFTPPIIHQDKNVRPSKFCK